MGGVLSPSGPAGFGGVGKDNCASCAGNPAAIPTAELRTASHCEPPEGWFAVHCLSKGFARWLVLQKEMFSLCILPMRKIVPSLVIVSVALLGMGWVIFAAPPGSPRKLVLSIGGLEGPS